MQIGIPTETVAGESRVAATPETVKKLINAGHSIVIQRGAGVKAAYIDSAYEQVGATITDDCSAVERLGKEVHLTEGSEENIKITTPVDLAIAEAILQRRGE